MAVFSQIRDFDSITIQEIKIDSSSIRAIQVLKDSSMYFASSNGYIGLANLSNKELKFKKIIYDTIVPHFRSIASNGNNIYVLSVESPALLYQYNNENLKLVYKEEHKKVFYDAMAFFDEQNGIAMGDPTEGCLSIILTNDGGNTWNKIPCSKLPKTEEGEAAFAASNGNIAISGTNAWLVTGGKRARVFHTPDMGKIWKVYDTPIVQGGQMTGIFSVDFYDSKNGIIFGGDWSKKEDNIANKAITNDGGKTWKLIADGEGPGYKSCVQYVPDTNGKEIFAVGSTGISFSNDGGYTWKKVSDEKYYTIRFVNKNIAWLAGNNKIGKMILKLE
ncbi:MAG: oxidoreductase [Flavobacteriaceae bacterium]|nr:oxidoreductase [Flavobacteriaceae bacterium]